MDIEKIINKYQEEQTPLSKLADNGLFKKQLFNYTEWLVKNYESLDNVRLSCLQEVWQAWCESDKTTDFDNWLHDKLHEA